MLRMQCMGKSLVRESLDLNLLLCTPCMVLRSCSRLRLEAVTRRVLPEHTRDALFQLFCDVRANTPKDRVFFARHAQALQPRTFSGWLVSALYSRTHLVCTSSSYKSLH